VNNERKKMGMNLDGIGCINNFLWFFFWPNKPTNKQTNRIVLRRMRSINYNCPSKSK